MELQEKGMRGYELFFFSKQVFFRWGGEDGVIPPLSKGGFFLRIGRGEFFWGWGLTQRFVSWVEWEGEVWLFFKVGRWDFKKIPRNCFLVVWDAVVGERRWVYIYSLFFFCDMVTWWIFCIKKIFIKINIFFLEMENSQHKN